MFEIPGVFGASGGGLRPDHWWREDGCCCVISFGAEIHLLTDGPVPKWGFSSLGWTGLGQEREGEGANKRTRN